MEKPPFLTQPGARTAGVRPVGELLPYRDRGQEAPGGASMADVIGTPNATEGQSGPSWSNLKG